MSDPTIAVIIPYFQREAGILRRALASVFAQTNAPSWKSSLSTMDRRCRLDECGS